MDEKPHDVVWYRRFTYSIVTHAETFFNKLGIKVASNPLTTIAICWIIVLLSGFGFLRFHQEKNPFKLWLPSQSSFFEESNWLMKTFQNAYRPEEIIITAPDVLTPEVLNELLEIMERVKNARSSQGYYLEDVCFKIPDLGMDVDLYRFFDYNDMSESTQCSFLESLNKGCLFKSLLELWTFSPRKIKRLTKDDIINKLNRHKIDPIFGNLKNYEELLSGIVRNETGHIVAATSLQTYWMVTVNLTAVDMDKTGNSGGTADWATEDALNFEETFIEVMKNISGHTKNFKLFYSASRSFGDISSATMFQDLDILIVGIFIMVIYVQFIISKLNYIEMRLLLGFAGLMSIGMAFIVAVGLCSLCGISYGPVHTSLPFLLMGLGVDDMFVLMACWEELTKEDKKLSIPEKIGLSLKHAGVSITVTTVTDVLAFIVGSSTVLPCLESYCIYAAMGVLVTFIFVTTFFTACFALDQKRLEDNRNGAFPWIKHHDYVKSKCSQRDRAKEAFRFIYSKIIFTLPGKLLVILVTLICLGFSIQGVLQLEQKFEPKWFLPKSSYLFKYYEEKMTRYPTMGYETGIYIGSINYTQELYKIKTINDQLRNNTDIVSSIVSWIDPFYDYIKDNYQKDLHGELLTEGEFNAYISKFLFSTKGARFQSNFMFAEPLKCGIPAPNITLSIIKFRFNFFNGPKEHLPAMNRIRNLASNQNFTTGDRIAIAWSRAFSTWITDEVIDIEVIRNIELALICVMACTIFLIADIQICFWIFICVLLTMVNVMGFMQRWGLTIDLVTCIGLELAIGLCVDYASHIGHTFLTISEGTNYDRSLRTVTSIGSAVLYGGLSTLIGVSMLGFSDAYSFQTFFKIFLLVVVFGLFHGVVLLPIILSWVGPKPYRTHKAVQQLDLALS